MASMDYCRFENTYSDLMGCVFDLQKGKVLNQYEEPYRKLLYQAAQEYIEAYENYEPKEEHDEDDDC